MKLFLIALLLQSIPVPPRAAMENPALTSPVPQKLKKDYDKLWARFLAGKQDVNLVKDLDKLLAKQKNFDAAVIVEAYVDLSQGKDVSAVQKFERALVLTPSNRIALYYLAEMAFARRDYARASDLYSKLLAVDSTRTDLEPKRQKAVLLATENLLRSAERAEQENRFADAEALYNLALNMAPREPTFHARLAGLFAKEKKWDQALQHYRNQMEFGGRSSDVEKNIAEALTNLGRADEAREVLERLRKQGNLDDSQEEKVTELEDLGRWSKDIGLFRKIQATESITREQLATLLVRYFPQVTEIRQTTQIVTDIQNSWAASEIQTTVGVGLIDPLPNHTFRPAAVITRGQFAISMARLVRILGVSQDAAPPIPLPDVDVTNALFRDVQLVMGLELIGLDDSGNVSVEGTISGEEAVRAVGRLLRLTRAKDA